MGITVKGVSILRILGETNIRFNQAQRPGRPVAARDVFSRRPVEGEVNLPELARLFGVKIEPFTGPTIRLTDIQADVSKIEDLRGASTDSAKTSLLELIKTGLGLSEEEIRGKSAWIDVEALYNRLNVPGRQQLFWSLDAKSAAGLVTVLPVEEQMWICRLHNAEGSRRLKARQAAVANEHTFIALPWKDRHSLINTLAAEDLELLIEMISLEELPSLVSVLRGRKNADGFLRQAEQRLSSGS